MKLSTQLQNVTFSNPRSLQTVHDWPTPTGPTQRDFGVLVDDAGRERVITWTKGHKPRLMAGWHRWARIVDGSDGRTYVVGFSGDLEGSEGVAVIYRGNLKSECVHYTHPTFHFRQLQTMALHSESIQCFN